MIESEVIRAWKDPLYRSTLSAVELGRLPRHPAGAIELKDDQLTGGAAAVTLTTAIDCTEYSFNHWRKCCPS